MGIRIITDSSADFDRATAKRRQVEIISMAVQFGNASFLDGKTITNDVFYTLLKEGRENPTTSQPTPAEFLRVFEEAKAAGVSGFISKPLFKSTLFYGLRGYAGMEMSPEVIKDDGKENFSFDGTRVLVAEDNELNWEIASELLGEFGLQLDWAENGQICVDMIENSEPGTYKAVLMDIRMPVMNGFEATKVIRKMERPDKDMPIIAMTADAFFEDVQKCMEAGMNAHVAKPIDVREVCRLLKKYLEM